jgi:hypothetical protein
VLFYQADEDKVYGATLDALARHKALWGHWHNGDYNANFLLSGMS